MENTETTDSRIQFGLRMETELFEAVKQLATVEERSVSNMIQRILKTNPQVQEILEAGETAAVAA